MEAQPGLPAFLNSSQQATTPATPSSRERKLAKGLGAIWYS